MTAGPAAGTLAALFTLTEAAMTHFLTPRRLLLTGLASLSAAAAAQGTPPVPASASAPASKVVAFEDLRWPAADPARSGPMLTSLLWGDPRSGPSAMYLKLTKGVLAPHLHTADYHLLVVQGSMKHWLAGEDERSARPLGPGSYWFQAGGEVHADACLSDECLVYLVWSGPRDGRMAPPSARP